MCKNDTAAVTMDAGQRDAPLDQQQHQQQQRRNLPASPELHPVDAAAVPAATADAAPIANRGHPRQQQHRPVGLHVNIPAARSATARHGAESPVSADDDDAEEPSSPLQPPRRRGVGMPPSAQSESAVAPNAAAARGGTKKTTGGSSEEESSDADTDAFSPKPPVRRHSTLTKRCSDTEMALQRSFVSGVYANPALVSPPKPGGRSCNNSGLPSPSKSATTATSSNTTPAAAGDSGTTPPPRPGESMIPPPHPLGIANSSAAMGTPQPSSESQFNSRGGAGMGMRRNSSIVHEYAEPPLPEELRAATPPASAAASADHEPHDQQQHQPQQARRHPSTQGAVYRTAVVNHRGRPVRVVLQEDSATSSTALLALANALALRGDIEIPLIDDADRHPMPRTSTSVLTNCIGLLCIDRLQTASKATGEEQTAQATTDIIDTLPRLAHDLGMNVGFRAPDDYECTADLTVFDALGVRLLHGWVADEASDGAQAQLLHKYRFNALWDRLRRAQLRDEQRQRHNDRLREFGSKPTFEEACTMDESDPDPTFRAYADDSRSWLAATASQLSLSGILQLQRDVQVGDLVVFFRQDNFTVLTKTPNGVLLRLLTDETMVMNGHVWETVEDMDGTNTRFVPEYPDDPEGHHHRHHHHHNPFHPSSRRREVAEQRVSWVYLEPAPYQAQPPSSAGVVHAQPVAVNNNTNTNTTTVNATSKKPGHKSSCAVM